MKTINKSNWGLGVHVVPRKYVKPSATSKTSTFKKILLNSVTGGGVMLAPTGPSSWILYWIHQMVENFNSSCKRLEHHMSKFTKF